MEDQHTPHWKSKTKFLRFMSGEDVEKEYNKLSTSESFPISSTINRNSDGSYDAFIFYKKFEA